MPEMASDCPLSKIFISALPSPSQGDIAPGPALDALLSRSLQRARSAWPEIRISAEIFLPFLAERIREVARLEAVLQQMNVGDLYLACGCSEGDERAVEVFKRLYFPLIEKAVAAIEISPSVIDDIKQQVFQKLFIRGEKHKPGICHYEGEGELTTWIRVVATRQAIDTLRRTKLERPLDDAALADLEAETDDPELRFLKHQYRDEFKDAFGRALATLTHQERNLLRYQLLEGLLVDQIAALYNVHRATVARWLKKVREKLLAATSKALSESLALKQGEFESIMKLIQSELNVSITRLLKVD
jgi:RNA polymerase sigma-70 factor, ECF subfamily